ncbi:MAG: ATP-binding cassette domain-containing protein, partial [Vicinamibacterales bacterium]
EGRVRDLMKLRDERAAYRAESGPVRMSVDAADASGRLVFEAKHVSKSFGGAPIIRDYSQRILRGDRVGLIGPNGSGKTTLLKLLVGELTPDAGTIRRGSRVDIAYFDQQRDQLDPDRTVADTVNDGNDIVVINGAPRHVLGYLADFLFPRERAVSPVRLLSGGERNRLMLARLFARPANVLVMDEPTNDLDIETLDLLEELITDFEGTILLVSHDRVFIDHIVTSTLAFEGEGHVTEYVGGYNDYVRQSSVTSGRGSVGRDPGSVGRDAGERLPPAPGAKSPSATEREPSAAAEREGTERLRPRVSPGADAEKWDPASREKSGGSRKLSYRESRELESLPALIESLEAEQSRLQREAGSPGFYKETADHIRAVLARIDAIGPELEAALARWMELEDRN